MNFNKQTWLVIVLAVGLVMSLVGNWYLWRGFTGWMELDAVNAILSTEGEARLIMVTQKLHEEGRREEVSKHLGFMLAGETDYLELVIQHDGDARRRERAAAILASIEDGSILKFRAVSLVTHSTSSYARIIARKCHQNRGKSRTRNKTIKNHLQNNFRFAG